MHRVRKFVEVSTGWIGYAMTAATLSEASKGSTWIPDPSFKVADVLLADPDFVSVLKMVLRDGHVMVPAPRANDEKLSSSATAHSNSGTLRALSPVFFFG